MDKKTSEIFTKNPPPFISKGEMAFLLESDKEYSIGVKDTTVSERKLKEYQTSNVRRFMNITGEDLDSLLIDEDDINEDKISTEDEEETQKEEDSQEVDEDEKEEKVEDEEYDLKEDDDEPEKDERDDDVDETDDNQEVEDETEEEEVEEKEEEVKEEEEEVEEEEEEVEEVEEEEVEEEEKVEEEEDIEKKEKIKKKTAKDIQEEKEREEELFEYTAQFVAPWYKSKLILISLLVLFLLLMILNTITVLNFIAVDPSELPNNVMSFSEEETIILKDRVKEKILNDVLFKFKSFDENLTTTTNNNKHRVPDVKVSVVLDDLMVFPKLNNYKEITYIKMSMEVIILKEYLPIIKKNKMLLKEVVYKEICNLAEKRDSKAMPLNRKIVEILKEKLNSLFKTNTIKDIKIITFDIKRK